MIFHLFNPVHFEKWSWENSIKTGIGGSETSAVEMSRELALLGHEVHCYSPLPEGTPRLWESTHWHDLSEYDTEQPGVHMVYRHPPTLEKFDKSRTDQCVWLCFQDWEYALTEAQVSKMDRAIVLCRSHEQWLLNRHPYLKGKTSITRNGLKMRLIREVEAKRIPPRNYKKILFASSPDRGLRTALKVFARAREYVPDLEFYASYGYDNISKLIAQGAEHFRKDRDETLAYMEEVGGTFLGRITQPQLYYEWLTTAMNVYLTTFSETGYITGIESSALGAIPIFTPRWAQKENLPHGIWIDGDPSDGATIARAAGEVVRLAKNPELQDKIRAEMMPDMRARWDWSQFASLKPGENWQDFATEDLGKARNRGKVTAVFPDAFRLPSGQSDNDDEVISRERWLKFDRHADAVGLFVMFDIGAADGAWSIAAAKLGAQSYAIDPAADFTQLQRNIDANNVNDLVTLVPMHVASFSGGFVELTWGDVRRKVPMMSLDAFYLSSRIPYVDFIKIDVEGDELEVLRGAMGLLCDSKPRLMIEVHEETVPGKKVTLEEVKRFLDKVNVGYQYEEQELWYEGKRYYHLYAEVKEVDRG